MSFGKVIQLNTGATIPEIGLGTCSDQNKVESAVEIAVRNGYRHLDLAMIYQNQDEVGRALKKVILSVVTREQLFITSKLWNCSHQQGPAEAELDETLKQLGLTYLDLYLVHWPVAFEPGHGLRPSHPTKEGEAYLDLKTSLVKSIGVSNFTIEHIQGLIDATGVAPAVNQIEAHPLLPQDDLAAYCKQVGVHITAYSPLGNNGVGKPMLTENVVVKEVAEKLGATPAQVLVAWGVYRGYSVIPKSVQEGRIISNFKQIALSKEDYEKVTAIGAPGNFERFNIPFRYIPKWDINLFDDELEKTATYRVNIV
ncbi:NADP-dependent oxidoreductase domain-containing protein [Suillus discolor]|uniref:NADP-dependent oxidoreductase domain-containing protein n=1 Tax=Suillus discolor TaxID=1912936 RepID=A0A9P7JQC9_9AGAM|nr:NADP-dependent oxidoreductase domain-containing protein [Suillus discolor]KAG2098429.1 NADP-dependent oxidoreductase domain-containing protein [Suillus discolor]